MWGNSSVYGYDLKLELTEHQKLSEKPESTVAFVQSYACLGRMHIINQSLATFY